MLLIQTSCTYLSEELEQVKKQNPFLTLLGRKIELDQELVEIVKNSEVGKKHVFDTDGDEKIDVIYFIDTAKRHGVEKQPLIVKIIDEDGDMSDTMEGDKDSDLYIADWFGDGSIDRVIDYYDEDADQDVDEQYLYFLREQDIFVTWVKDYGDDNRLWYDVNYEYQQNLSQWKSDFNGDEMFVFSFRYDSKEKRLIPEFETAFSFYDPDSDNYSEEVIRLSGAGNHYKDVRYSLDLDNDNESNSPIFHDYDLSISGIGSITLPGSYSRQLRIRDFETDPIARWEEMPALVKTSSWEKLHLTWDENDNNIDPWLKSSNNERWEGVINAANDLFPAVGGPPSSPFNKRNEVDMDASGKMQFYFSPVDQRLHLFGAETGWIKVDFDNIDRLNMEIRMEDSDGDGFFDKWLYDLNGNSVVDYTIESSLVPSQLYPMDYTTLHSIYLEQLHHTLSLNNEIIAKLKIILMKQEPNFSIDIIESYYNKDLVKYGASYGLGTKIRNSIEGQRYYTDLIRIRYWKRFLDSGLTNTNVLQTEYNQGNLDTVNNLLEDFL
ncbi:hypothetical protein [Splendidivirga corallicola]